MNNQKFYSGRRLHYDLKIGTQYTTWIKRVISDINKINSKNSKNGKIYILGIDYFKIDSIKDTLNPKNPHSKYFEHIITQQLYNAIKNFESPQLQ